MAVRTENYGKGKAYIDAIDPQELRTRVRAVFDAPSYQPPVVPATAIELMALARRSDVTFDRISALLEKDPLVAAKVLKTAQSAFYAGGGRVQSLHDAVVRLGLETLAHLFFEATLSMRVFRAPGYDGPMAQLRRHSAVTAHVARAVCRMTSISDQYAFLCGLLHDVGLAAAAGIVGTAVPFHLACPVIVEAHAEVARAVCRAWHLPPDVTLVVAHHHQVRIDGMVHPVACAVAVADWIAHQTGSGLEGEAGFGRPELELRTLDIQEPALKGLLTEARQIAQRAA